MFPAFRAAIQGLFKSPGFTLVAVLTIALGVGANTAIFSVVNAVLLNPFPYRDANRLLFVGSTTQGQEGMMPVTYLDYLDWRQGAKSFEQLAFATNRTAALTGTSQPTMLTAAAVSASTWPLLGMQPVLGRTFSAEEDQPGAAPVCVISYSTWQTTFGADANILRRTAMIDGRAYAIIGVMPPRFKFWAGDVWLPVGLEADSDMMRSRIMRSNTWVVARPKPGVTFEAAEAELNVIAEQIALAHPETNQNTGVYSRLLSDSVTGPFQQPLMVLLVAVACVLLIACANVANLLLARAASRQREYAIRVALGATRGQLIRQMLWESVPLTLAGGAAGLLAGAWGLQALLLILPPDAVPAEAEITVNGPVMAFALATVLVTMLGFSLFPAISGSRPQLTESLQEGSRGTTGAQTARLRAILIVAEISLSLTLLVGAGLLIRSLGRLHQVDPGFNPENLVVAPAQLPIARYPTGESATAFYRQLLGELERNPRISAVAASTNVPFFGGSGMPLINADRVYTNINQLDSVQFSGVMGDYFHAQGLRLLQGRAFDAGDRADSARVIVLNDAAVKRYLPEGDPIGRSVMMGLPENLIVPGMLPDGFDKFEWATVVGVVQSARHFGLQSELTPAAYVPIDQLWDIVQLRSSMVVLARTEHDPATIVPDLRSAFAASDPDLPIAQISTMESVLFNSLRQSRFNSVLLTLFAVIALLLAMVGIYGVVAWNVSQRTREIGIRQALGANRDDVLRLVVGQGMRTVAIGIAVGLAGSFATAHALRSMLFEISAFDPWTFVLVGVLLALVALGACLLPALRAARISPLEALRSD